MMKTVVVCCALAFVLVTAPRNASAQTGTKLVPADGTAYNKFGRSVAISENFLFCGSPKPGSSGPGAVYVYERQGGAWSPIVTLQQGTPGVEDQFGAAVSVSRGILAVGAPVDPTVASGAGAVHVYAYSAAGWASQATLLPTLSTPQHFGASVDLWDDTLVVGEQNTITQGRAHVYRLDAGGNWVVEGTLAPTPGDDAGGYGESVAIYQDRVLVGASEYEIVGGGAVGAVYPYLRVGSSWTPTRGSITRTRIGPIISAMPSTSMARTL